MLTPCCPLSASVADFFSYLYFLPFVVSISNLLRRARELFNRLFVCFGSVQLGDMTPTFRSTVPSVDVITGVASIAAGGHTCVVVTTGGMRCWGSNGFGQASETLAISLLSTVLGFQLMLDFGFVCVQR